MTPLERHRLREALLIAATGLTFSILLIVGRAVYMGATVPTQGLTP
jgi:hypothetical protein